MYLERHLVCPDCNAKLGSSVDQRMRCPSCQRTFSVDENLINLLPTELTREDSAEEHFWKTDPREGLSADPSLTIDAKRDEISFCIEKVLPNLNLEGTILEIGSGSCWLSALTKKVFPGTFVVASDVSPAALSKGEKVATFLDAKIDRYVACKVENLPFENGLFDRVIGSAVLHHTEPQKALRQIYRVLKKDGEFIGLGEPVIPRWLGLIWKSRLCSGGRRQRRLGVKEGSYSLDQWKRGFREARFRQVEFALRMYSQYKQGNGTVKAYYHMTQYLPKVVVISLLPCVVVVAASK